MREYLFTVPEELEDERVDKALTLLLEGGCSRSYIARMIKDGLVYVDGAPVKGSFRVKEDAQIRFEMPDQEAPDIPAENIPLDILYEDEDIIVVNKPKGMVVHPGAGHYTGTLVNALLYHCGDSLSGINGVLRPGIVHRIDRDTTGSLVVCKNDAAHRYLAQQLKDHAAQRIYYAICQGALPDSEGMVSTRIGRSPQDRKKMAAGVPYGKAAVTHYRSLEPLRGHTYVECRLETGRTHQIRVHLSSIGHPLLGDTVYGGAGSVQIRTGPNASRTVALEGQCLHAMTLGFVHPSKGWMRFDAPLPEYFRELLEGLRIQ
ncbi:MAG: RluA family pseudouridine synthase [Lachnospiraceae bacterium]|nr:RluA family pseudouridine synthase [Lachnospiraceae bacterium]